MMKIKISPLVALFLIWFATSPSQAALTDKSDRSVLPQPGVELLPQDVVRIVINALADNDRPFDDAGIATTFEFASPANKVITGPLEKFTEMVKNHVYGIMVNHVESEFSEVVLVGNDAFQMVKLTGSGGGKIVFAFRLSKQQDGEFEGMWMTDAVWPISDVDIPEQGF